MTLADVKKGHMATIQRLNDTGSTRRRLMDMGLTRGTQVKVVKVAPLGDPIELTVRGYELTLRNEDAKLIDVVA